METHEVIKYQIWSANECIDEFYDVHKANQMLSEYSIVFSVPLSIRKVKEKSDES